MFSSTSRTPNYRTPLPPESTMPPAFEFASASMLRGEAPTRVEWIWPGRIPRGKLTLLVGDPGLGKSIFTLDIAARLSRGEPWPDARGIPTTAGSAMVLTAEDDLADTVLPRLTSAGANLDRILLAQGRKRAADGSLSLLSLNRDLEVLRKSLDKNPDCRLLIIDPVSSYLADSHVVIRTALLPLAKLADDYNVAVVAVTHLNKRLSGRAIYRTTGSLGFVAVARSSWCLVADPLDETKRLMLPIKNNLTRTLPGLAFRITSPDPGGIGTVHWCPEPIEQSLDEVLNSRPLLSQEAREYRDRLTYSAEWLREQLCGGPRPRDELVAAAEQEGFDIRQLYRAAAKIGVIKTKQSMSADSWVWSLSGERNLTI